MNIKPGQVYQVNEHPEHIWVVVEVKDTTLRGVYLSMPESLIRIGVRPGTEFEFELKALYMDGLTRLA